MSYLHTGDSLLEMEALEVRRMLSSAVRSIDGTGNNLINVLWGSTDEQLLRNAAAAYADGISAPGGTDRPSARAISNAVSVADPAGTKNARNMSAWVYVWGQFIDHDLDLTGGTSPSEFFNVAVPKGDPQFDPQSTGTQVIALNRSQYAAMTGLTSPREQTNSITSWLDGSVVYGSDATRATALRTMSGGKLKTTAGDLMPFNTDGLPIANDAHIVADSELFLGGDVRSNENIDLIALQTLFVREHNRLANQIARGNRRLSDEQIYQQARSLVGAEIQSITYNEFLPALMGTGALDRYRGYDARTNPGVSTEFSTAAFRLGHSLLGDDIEFLNNDGEQVHDPVELKDAFFNPGLIEQLGIDPIMKYLASDAAQEIDTRVVDSVRNFLFGPAGAGGFDLAALNIQRGRDHGLEDYNTMRASFGLPRVTTFAQITSDLTLQKRLQQLYGTVNNIDAWVGGLAEDHARGSSVGPLFKAVVADQFERIRDGDRFWFERQFAGTAQLRTLESTTLSDVIQRNTGISNLQSNVFMFDVKVSGKLFNDRNADGRQERGESALAGWTVQLKDDDGSVVAATMSAASGRYTFDQLDLGTYTVEVAAPSGWRVTTEPRKVNATRAVAFDGIDFGYLRNGGHSGGEATKAEPVPDRGDVLDLLQAGA